MPIDRGDYALEFVRVNNLIFFILEYFHFWPTIIGLLSVQLVQLPAQSFLYNKSLTKKLVAEVVAGTIW